MIPIINEQPIAILLGVYNGELYIKEQLESLLSQSFKNWTLYIRDDASIDNTLEIIESYAKAYENIFILKDDKGNLGCNGNYFSLLSKVESKYYMFCNADDYWFYNKIEISFEKMISAENKTNDLPIIVHTDLTISDKNLNILSNSYWESVNTDPEKFKTFNKSGICSCVSGATMLFNQSAKEISFPVSKFAPFFDQWMALKVVKTGLILTIHQSTMSYRQIGTNLAAVSIGKDYSFSNKIKTLNIVLKQNIKEATMLRNIGWGGAVKYLYYKIIVLVILRVGTKYKRENYNE